MASGGMAWGASTRSRGATAIETVPREKLGLELWSCLAAYEVDAPETLALVARIGYAYVEAAPFGYGSISESDAASSRIGMSAKAFRKALDDNGLWCLGGHGMSAYPYDDSAWKRYVEGNLIVGARHLGANSTFPATRSDCLRYVDAVHRAHDVARSMGFRGYQYNHLEAAQWNLLRDQPDTFAWEFVVQHTTPDVWNPQLDTLHALQPLGTIARVIHYIRKHPGRLPLYHMKDGTAPVLMPDGSVTMVGVGPAMFTTGQATEFGVGDFGRPDPSDPQGRPHAGFQDVLTAIRETQKWSEVLLQAESDTSMATCVDHAQLAYMGLKGLRFPYRR